MASGELEARKEGSDGEGRLCDGFWGKFASLMNKDDVDTILSEQEDMLETLEVANEKLSSLNNLSEKSFTLHAANLRTYTQTLGNMKKELDSVFRRIRFLKARLATQYPEAFSEAGAAIRAGLEAVAEER